MAGLDPAISAATQDAGAEQDMAVWAERHESIGAAIQREKNIKHCPRAWKVGFIVGRNPDWDRFYPRLP